MRVEGKGGGVFCASSRAIAGGEADGLIPSHISRCARCDIKSFISRIGIL